jgi:nitroimidazol reductase NimA-like FMN-containing flavoprotein (pyridoxamine 5'-phosphate oxidase superfamily)
MRRKDREITDTSEKLEIIKNCKHCRLGLSDDNIPYVIPLNYGYSYGCNGSLPAPDNGQLTLYFHSAKEGRKIDIIQKNNNACFEIDCDTKLVEGENACNYSYEFKSIIGFGKIEMVESAGEKITGLNCIMKHQAGKDIKFEYGENDLNSVLVLKMTVDEFTGKRKV